MSSWGEGPTLIDKVATSGVDNGDPGCDENNWLGPVMGRRRGAGLAVAYGSVELMNVTLFLVSLA